MHHTDIFMCVYFNNGQNVFIFYNDFTWPVLLYENKKNEEMYSIMTCEAKFVCVKQ